VDTCDDVRAEVVCAQFLGLLLRIGYVIVVRGGGGGGGVAIV